MIDFIKGLIIKAIGPSKWTSIMGIFALVITYATQGSIILENIVAFADMDPLTVVNEVELKEALEFLGLGTVAGFLGLKAKDNDVSTEDVKKYNQVVK